MASTDTSMDDNDIKSLCTQFNIPLEELSKPFSIWRFKVLHVRGVDALTSEEVYEYFEQRPYSIEWLSNISCNVTFESTSEACGALLTIAEGIIIHKNDEGTVKGLFDLPVITSDKLEIPVPPNYRYIMGTKHPKTKTVIVRFATIHDRKSATVAEDQTFIKQESTMSGKRTISGTLASDRMDVDQDHGPRTDIRRTLAKKPARIRMRMRADEEEERIKRSRSSQRYSRSDVRSRLSMPEDRYSKSYSSSLDDRRTVPLRSTHGLLTNSKIVKSKRVDSVWRRTVEDPLMGRNRRDLPPGDLRSKLSRSMVRIQVTYDDEEIAL